MDDNCPRVWEHHFTDKPTKLFVYVVCSSEHTFGVFDSEQKAIAFIEKDGEWAYCPDRGLWKPTNESLEDDVCPEETWQESYLAIDKMELNKENSRFKD